MAPTATGRHHSIVRRAFPLLCLVLGCAASSKPAPTAEPATTPAAKLDEENGAAPTSADATAAGPSDTIARTDLERVLAHGPGWLLRQIAPEPYRPKGRFEGWLITDVFPDAPELCAARCDLRKGDVILSVAGDPVETPDAFVALLARLPELSEIEVVRLRDGALERKRFAITP